MSKSARTHHADGKQQKNKRAQINNNRKYDVRTSGLYQQKAIVPVQKPEVVIVRLNPEAALLLHSLLIVL